MIVFLLGCLAWGLIFAALDLSFLRGVMFASGLLLLITVQDYPA